jgi:hypothetical protein
MILFEWDAPEGNPGKCAYTCMLLYSIVVSHLSLNFLRLLLLCSIYLSGRHGGVSDDLPAWNQLVLTLTKSSQVREMVLR